MQVFLRFVFRLNLVPVANICLDRPSRSRESSTQPRSVTPQSTPSLSPENNPIHASSIAPSKTQKVNANDLHDSLHQAFPKSAIYSIIPGYATASLPQKSMSSTPEPELPQPLKSLYKKKYESCNTFQVLRLAKTKICTIDCTKEQANFLEEATCGQSNSTLWFNHKVGHITASIMGKVAKCREKVLRNSLFKNIMQYSKTNMDIPGAFK